MIEIAAPHNKSVRIAVGVVAHCALKNTIVEVFCQDIVNRLCCNMDSKKTIEITFMKICIPTCLTRGLLMMT